MLVHQRVPLFSHIFFIIPLFHHDLPMISPSKISRFPQPGHMISVSSRCLDSSISKRLKAVEIRVMSVFKPVVTRAKQTWHVWVHGCCLMLGMELDCVWGWKPVRTCSNHNIYIYKYVYIYIYIRILYIYIHIYGKVNRSYIWLRILYFKNWDAHPSGYFLGMKSFNMWKVDGQMEILNQREGDETIFGFRDDTFRNLLGLTIVEL